jgi:uncharacterized protein YjiS (DUF1127 family)
MPPFADGPFRFFALDVETALHASLIERFAQYRAYRATVNELSALSNRELNDLGIGRSMIRDVAANATAKV